MLSDETVYFDSAATAQKPQSVIDTLSKFYSTNYSTVHRAVYQKAQQTTANFQEVRQKVARFLNAPHFEEVIFTRGTTEGINLVARSFGKAFLSPGDEVILSELEHHSNIVPWQMICQEVGATIKIIPALETGELDLLAYEKLLSSKTRLVAVAHIANSIGTRHPIKKMVKMAHSVGAKLLVDGAQAICQTVVDVQELGCDFYLFSGHKLFGPTGVGVLWGKKELLHQMPPYHGGGDMIEKVTFEKTTYAPLPMKFEAGTPPIAQVLGLGAAIDYVTNIGMDKIEAWDQTLLRHATKALEQIPEVTLIGKAPEKGGIVSFVVQGVHHLDLGTFLDLSGIEVRTGHLCAQPTMARFGIEGCTRASFAFYNTLEEVDRFIQTLQRVTQKLLQS
jgi:cysteine desulfurase/selenocysteine lyase